jgi:hypothetical protein
MTPEKLYTLRRIIESEVFQEGIIKPLRKEQEKIKNNFFSDSLKESWRKGGRQEGIQMFFDNLKKIHEEVKTLEDSEAE